MNKAKPQTIQEIEQDIQKHPDRGLVNGVPIVSMKKRVFSGQVSDELYRQALIVGGSMGLTQDEILTIALSKFASDPGYQALKNASLQVKAEKHGIPVRQVINKIFGIYKAITRSEKLCEESREEDLCSEDSQIINSEDKYPEPKPRSYRIR
jgi:hypothetical protein